MDINSRLNWKPGMKLTAEGISAISTELDLRMTMFERTFLSVSHSALVAGAEFLCKPLFVGKKIVIERLCCKALLKNGRYLDIDERVELDYPSPEPGEYYLVAEIGDEEVYFESQGMPYVRPAYKYSLKNLQETEESVGCPIAKFIVETKEVRIDQNYIAPRWVCGDDPRILTSVANIVAKAEEISKHANLRPGVDREEMTRFVYLLKNLNGYDSLLKLYATLKDYLLAKHYHVFQSNGTQGQLVDNRLFFVDVQEFMNTILVAQDSAIILLDKVTPFDDKIDVDKLKREIKEELTAQLLPEIKESLYEELKKKISEELTEELTKQFKEMIETLVAESKEKLRAVLSDSLHTTLHDGLSVELNDSLYPKLYDELYQKLYQQLYDALFVPEPEIVDDFMPDI